MRVIPFEKLRNVRDLGGIPVCEGRIVKPGLMFRGSALASATERDIAKLSDELGLRRVVDVRIGYEREAKPDPIIPGAEGLHIPYYDIELVGVEYFKPLEGTIALGNDFACDPDDFYADMANELTAQQMGKALHAILESACNDQPVYFHCSGGKDRAGITSLLILEILGASEQDILEDYLITNVDREKEREKIYQRFLLLCQGNEEFANATTDAHRARPENLVAYRGAIDARYGSMDSFITDVLGISAPERAQLRQLLTVPASQA